MIAALHGRQQRHGQADEMGPGILELRSAADKLPSSRRLAPEFPRSLTAQRMDLLNLPAVEKEGGEGPGEGMEVGNGEGEGEG
jgi:hypothetical protein